MRKAIWLLVLVSVVLVSAGAYAQLSQTRQPTWAFQIIDPVQPPGLPEPGQAAGSTRTYTPAQIENTSAPPDWFPELNNPKPAVITTGEGARLACGACHLMSGLGHPESADLAGLPASYTIRQMQDFKSGARKDISRMNGIAAVMTDTQMREAAEWFEKLKPVAWSNVVESATVPKTYIGPGRMRFVHPDGGTEPIGNRIIVLPKNVVLARSRDPNSGFTSHVPPGSIARGEALVKTGGNGKTIACTICHGDDLMGLGDIPRLAGVHPIYIARQLFIFKNGDRNGPNAELMTKPVAQLTEADIVAISAYLGSLTF